MNTITSTESNKDKKDDDDDDVEQNVTQNSPRTKTLSATSNGAESSTSNRVTKSRLRSTSKTESVNNETIEETPEKKTPDEPEANGEDDNNNNSIELLNKSSPVKETVATEQTNEPPVNLRLRITPSSTSSISIALNDSDNNNNTNDKSSIDNPINISTDQDTAEVITDDEEPIEKIEAVRNDQDGISFRVKINGESEAQWIAAKIANRKYPQAVIAFWEGHVEFT